jgi:hypothetical protein
MNAPAPSSISRRHFVSVLGTAAGLALAPRLRAAEPARAKKSFEVAASLYAWDLHDEGVERALDNLQLAAVNSVYLIGIMHPEMRPMGGVTFPHNPARQTWDAEDARAYWHPQRTRYGRIQPRLSDHGWLNDTDWLRVLADAARQRGFKLGMELSHAVVDRERMLGEYADLAPRNLQGTITPVGQIKWLLPPCPNQPATQEYLLAIATDVVTNHGIDFLQSCMMAFDPALPERGGGCFCDQCMAVAPGFGVDLEQTRAVLRRDPQDAVALSQWNNFRYASVAQLYARLRHKLHALKPSAELRYNFHSRSCPYYGASLPHLRPNIDSMRLSDYTEQNGDPALLPAKRAWIDETRRQLGPDFPLITALGVRMKATPELVRAGVRIAVEGGSVGISLGHYDGASLPILRAVREGLVEGGVLS